MEQQGFFSRMGNASIRAILTSPLHGMLDRQFTLITVRGCKSGKQYVVPVNYTRDGRFITIISRRPRSWWRNLRGGAPVTLRLDGRDVRGKGIVMEDPAAVIRELTAFIARMPKVPRRYSDIDQAAQERVIVQVKLS